MKLWISGLVTRLLFTSLAVASCSFASAGETKDLLAILGDRSQQIESLQGRFEQQKKITVLPAPLVSSGRFSLQQGEFIEWQLLAPVQQTIRLTPGGITLEAVGKPAGQLGDAMPAQGAETLTRVFMAVVSGEWQTLRDYFEVAASGTPEQWQLLLTPRSPGLAAYIREITIRGGEFTEQLDIAEANGDSTRITLVIDKAVHRQP